MGRLRDADGPDVTSFAKGALGGVLGTAVVLGLGFGLALVPEPNRLMKRVLKIPAELSGPHRYELAAHQTVLVAGSRDFIYCALSMSGADGGFCAISHETDGWHVGGADPRLAASCAVTCLK